MELVVLAFVVVGLLGLLAYARQVNLYGEKVAQRFRLPLFITIGFTVHRHVRRTSNTRPVAQSRSARHMGNFHSSNLDQDVLSSQ